MRERNRKLVNDAKSIYIQKHGSLYFQLCRFSFADTYGEMGLDFIEAHHIKPVSTIKPGEETRIEDLLMVCANCHRMLHRGDPQENLDALRDRFGARDGK
ncbi:MAG TPA: HNH endonuclease [bacterium]|nr:HNH endonuclease [bacterium]HPG47059.1 HNH endonuclease [bacterium]HPM99353.1 HNH endonuclease [bacterium]